MYGEDINANGKPKTLVVEDDQSMRDLVRAMLAAKSLSCDGAGCLSEARSLLAETSYDVLFVDVGLADGSGLSLVRELVRGSIIVVVMTGKDDLNTAIDAIRLGAFDFISKPFTAAEFLQRVDGVLAEWNTRARMRKHALALESMANMNIERLSRSRRRIEEVHDATVIALGGALNLKDRETADHCQRVSRNSVELGSLLSLSKMELKNLEWGAYLHDIGKIGVPEGILFKQGTLTPEERLAIEKHPVMGYELLRNIGFLVRASDVVLCHHERFDGTGYPHGLRGKIIPLHARVFSILDTLDAMTSLRPYQGPVTLREAMEEVERQAGRQFDPDIVRVFLSAPPLVWAVQKIEHARQVFQPPRRRTDPPNGLVISVAHQPCSLGV